VALLQAQIRDRALLAHRPFITLTYAQSLNGTIAAPGNRPVRLSGDESMRLTHLLRTSHDAILVGIGTVLADDPRLTARLVEGPQPQPIVLDSNLRLPRQARLLDHPRPPIVITGADPDPVRRAALETHGAVVLPVPDVAPGLIDLRALLGALHDRGIRSIMVEGGARVIRAFLYARLVDALVVTLAPRFLVGVESLPANGSASMVPGAARMPHLASVEYTPLGRDLVVWGRPAWEG
jgi:3,4-dihydroxy 2-butanone 4-phosphate synthase/GTP cyclohydrolase II